MNTESKIIAYIRARAAAANRRITTPQHREIAAEVAVEFDALATDIAAGMHRS